MHINGLQKNAAQLKRLTETVGNNDRTRTEDENFRDSLLKRICSERMQGAKEVPVRGIPYEECDRVKINVLEGYTVKIKMEEGSQGKASDVYVEMKWENGDKRACLYGLATLKKNGADIMERIAYEMLEGRSQL